MNSESCESDGCDRPAVVHIYEDGRKRHYCESHAVQALGAAGPVTADADDESRDVSLSLRHSDRVWQVDFRVPFSMISRIPKETATRYCVIPVAKSEGALTLASREALAHEDWEFLRFVANQEIRLIMATVESIRKAISLAYFITRH